MHPVQPILKFDLRVSDYLAAFAYGCLPDRMEAVSQRLYRLWGQEAHTLAATTLRAGFDLYLQALALPPGSEVLMSAITHPDMVAIVRNLGLVPVPVDVDPTTMAPDMAALRRAVSPRARVLVVAHLFGGHVGLDDMLPFCREHGLQVVEDCAQTFGGHYRGHPEAAIALFSFGPLKTRTALAGALMTVRDPAVRARMAAIQDAYPCLPRFELAKRAVKYALISLIAGHPWTSGLVIAFLAARGRDPNATVRSWTRSVAGAFQIARFRLRPSVPLLRLLARRLGQRRDDWVPRRRAVGEALGRQLAGFERPGAEASDHLHWLFPVMVADPEQTLSRLLAAGYQAFPGLSNLQTFDPPDDRPQAAPHEARRLFASVLMLPVHPGLTPADAARIADVVSAVNHRPLVAPVP